MTEAFNVAFASQSMARTDAVAVAHPVLICLLSTFNVAANHEYILLLVSNAAVMRTSTQQRDECRALNCAVGTTDC